MEDEEIGKKRLIRDATHRIRCRDKLRAPGAREKKQLLLEMMERGEVAWAPSGSTALATGTRIAAAGLRAIESYSGKLPLDLLLYADDLEFLAITSRGMGIALSYLYLSAMGSPFKWAKTGRLQSGVARHETEYSSYNRPHSQKGLLAS